MFKFFVSFEMWHTMTCGWPAESAVTPNLLEDASEALLWRWDLKDIKLLPKQHLRAAKERRKQWQQVYFLKDFLATQVVHIAAAASH